MSQASGHGLLDTSVVIRLPTLAGTDLLPAVPLISTVTLAELSVGPLVSDDEQERAERQARLQRVEADFEPLAFDVASARAFGQVGAALRRAGRKPAARSFDAMIAATAMANGLPLYTCNPRDFASIDGLDVFAVLPGPGQPPGSPAAA